jgi:hypothetical protein
VGTTRKEAQKGSARGVTEAPRQATTAGGLPKINALAVGWRFPGQLIESVPYGSKKSLLDPELIVFAPDITEFFSPADGEYKGKRALTDSHSTELVESSNHWQREIESALKAGKTVFVFGGGLK